MIKILLMHMFNASTFSFNKVLLSALPPFFLSGISALGGSILLLASLCYKGKLESLFNRSMLFMIIPLALCITYGAGVLKFYALGRLSSSHVAFFSALDPFLTALLCYILRGQRLTGLQIAGIVLASVGSLPMFLNSVSYKGTEGLSTGFSLLPLLAALGYVIINRYGWIRMTEVAESGKYSVSQIVSLMTFTGALFSLGTSAVTEISCTSFSCLFSFSLLGMLVYVMVISTLVCSQAYTSLLKEYSVTFLSLTEFLTPLFVALYGWLFLHEKVTWHFFVSALLVIVGLFIFSVPTLFHKRVKEYYKES